MSRSSCRYSKRKDIKAKKWLNTQKVTKIKKMSMLNSIYRQGQLCFNAAGRARYAVEPWYNTFNGKSRLAYISESDKDDYYVKFSGKDDKVLVGIPKNLVDKVEYWQDPNPQTKDSRRHYDYSGYAAWNCETDWEWDSGSATEPNIIQFEV